MTSLAIIGGTGFDTLPDLVIEHRAPVTTPYGDTSAALLRGRLAGHPVLFLPRHGATHGIAPHQINYRANIQALAQVGVTDIIALGAVGGIAADCGPGVLCVPDQLIDYTSGRELTFFSDSSRGDERAAVLHSDFTSPYCETLRQQLLTSAAAANVPIRAAGCLAVTQGPRLETAAEIRRLERDGCDLVGMTGMPEAILARELGLCYAALTFVVNWAAGKAAGEITMDEIHANLTACAGQVGQVLRAVVQVSGREC
ncbi:S-methyl-5'-thioinosine phosphorylase [Rhodoferax sp. 4810]|uniref:Probable S-methyl-5'-thioinosine phosphorylase n=1 Tax=Thiospirillum jenense TaxID=1653858 RepID=A0A839HCN3_9GAMM|nr:S-methyl-5'-thioinosine phosphorylase [Thiospirillum jenense]MBB1073081.1 S-methyl-5'-thioinosine phosphorylase [Rhodoferax jenense]MBB1125028.1 S-methyl-5'-thioinosine phosphorylase [Thiospirillum jenense]